MPYCPNCSCPLEPDEGECPNCEALFGEGSAWAPTQEPSGPVPQRSQRATVKLDKTSLAAGSSPPNLQTASQNSWSAVGVIFAIGFGCIALPLAASLLGSLATTVIPGCYCGSACTGCGANELVFMLIQGGGWAFLFAALWVFPVMVVLLLIAGVVSLFGGKQ